MLFALMLLVCNVFAQEKLLQSAKKKGFTVE